MRSSSPRTGEPLRLARGKKRLNRFALTSRTAASAFLPSKWRASFTSTNRRPAAEIPASEGQAWVWRFARRSWRPTAARSGSRARRERARRFLSLSRSVGPSISPVRRAWRKNKNPHAPHQRQISADSSLDRGSGGERDYLRGANGLFPAGAAKSQGKPRIRGGSQCAAAFSRNDDRTRRRAVREN